MIDATLLAMARDFAQNELNDHGEATPLTVVLDAAAANVENFLAERGVKAHADWVVRRSDTGTFLVTLHVNEAPQEIELELRR